MNIDFTFHDAFHLTLIALPLSAMMLARSIESMSLLVVALIVCVYEVWNFARCKYVENG